MHLINDKKITRSWAMYDWANSVYLLVILTAIFPAFYTDITSVDGSDKVQFMGREFVNSALYLYVLSFSYMLIALISPLLASIADYRGNKKRFMQVFVWIGAGSCAALYFFDFNNLYFGFTAFVLASIGFSGSIVFYNSYLPEIVSKDKQDIVSAQGYAFGYVGSSILLLICVLFIENPSWLGVESTQVVRLTFFGAGIWWVGFSLIPFYYLPKRSIKRKSGGKVFLKGYLELKQVLIQLRSLRYLRIFLIAFFFYSMGIQTVLYTAGLFGAKVIQLEPVNLVIAVLLIQFLAVGGAYMFSFLSNRIGNLYGLLVAMVIWIGICSTALFVRTEMDFYLLAAVVGLVMGGVQALSRSTYSKILPKTQNNAAYFSFYDVAEKVAIVLGLLIFGLMEELTGSMRNSIFSLIIFFIIGIPILLLLNKKGQIDTSK